MKTLLATFVVLLCFKGTVFATDQQRGPWLTLDGTPTKIYGHQGEKVFLPAHTLPGYEIAAIEGADFVEPDLALTKDGVLVCYHDLFLKKGTDVSNHPEFDHMKMNYTGIIGVVHETIVNDWFIQDFTLEQLRTIRVNQNQDGVRLQYFNGQFGIPTFQEFLDVIHKMTLKLNRTIGIIPELKHPSFHNRNLTDHYMENQFLNILAANGYALKDGDPSNCIAMGSWDGNAKPIPCPPLIVQNFDKSALEYISTQTDHDLMLVVHPDLPWLTYSGFEEVSSFIQYYCVWKEYMYVGVEAELAYHNTEYDRDLIDRLGGFIPPTEFVNEAHRKGIRMALFTINDSREPSRRGCAITPGCDPENKREELYYFFDMGLDGMFIESIGETREMRIEYDFLLQSAEAPNQMYNKL